MPPSLLSGPGTFGELGRLVRDLGARRVLLAADAGIRAAGYVDAALASLAEAGVTATPFHDFGENPTSAMVEAGRQVAAPLGVDALVGLGGGSSIDCAKGISFLLTNGGTMSAYRGWAKATAPLLPVVAVPTTAGTGSEAQSYALISDAVTHEKMACGDPGAKPVAVILDAQLTVTQPRAVTAAAGYDAIAHAVETWVTTARTPESAALSQQAWALLSGSFARVLAEPGDLTARGAMLEGAYTAGAAIERSMLGATHACANALTACYGTVHGVAVGLMLRHVVAWNAEGDPALAARYADLDPQLVTRLAELARVAGIPPDLASAGADRADLDRLVAFAAPQWTGTFNPRPFDAAAARTLFERAWQA